ncbi:bifunctional 3,4-dihydroxy-2-butanone-4-phosphate synthase/GTP cyclohydrolase II [Siminovitchia fortis]|uniref:Riboflavin biosynthesis protein RibBA n=1 Tax=Siminovitchia fortis TaxID=254758 RepID=A0A443J2R5_9BACI|nr:bifunctional 3,4-dihydroxy-2-butanone-4-phosphate synthase/GTP cyclohydrolase II [Siminovitchia fortis]RWR14616.1 bifunctional 3,4-dihydroxy-2-butanone-4-phosphate synthase/GTP cyclohydrolase II [Siminovitchia fortis]WHY80298.1 bifunctional 3,4-dihydroxy-2-butanone-4-phosphate synthase/GTP cyclohydrolase II [Siminovitchia fortis]
MFDSIEKALEELKNGKVIIVTDDEDRENEGDFVALAEKAAPEVINFMAKEGRGLICMPITEERAKELNLPKMADQNTDPFGTAFTVSVDHIDSHTGISAFERSETILKMLEEGAKPGDFKRPGHIFPLIAKEGGILKRPGHTEAAVDLAQLCGAKPAGVICEIMKDDGTMARTPDLRKMADEFGLSMITIKDLILYRNAKEKLVKREAEALLPTEYGDFKIIAYSNVLDYKEHLAIVKGDIEPDTPVIVRMHSECLTGDVFGSCRCDCGPQLQSALRRIEEEGAGVLLYLRQEGRGIGLINKLKAYKLQEEGLDTVEANERLGFPADLRDFSIGAQMLKDIGVKKLKLLTNNPRKVSSLSDFGFEVTERLPIQLPFKSENEKYLKTKAEKLGHLLTF